MEPDVGNQRTARRIKPLGIGGVGDPVLRTGDGWKAQDRKPLELVGSIDSTVVLVQHLQPLSTHGTLFWARGGAGAAVDQRGPPQTMR